MLPGRAAPGGARPVPAADASYDPDCRACPRLAAFLDDSRRRFPTYWSRPVPAFGDPDPRILMVGLAPGLHGANASGRPFTGDYAGVLLYQTLYDVGLSNQPTGEAPDDGLVLKGIRISNSVKCVPPDNKPEPSEIRQCNGYLAAEIAQLAKVRVFIALGRVAHDAALMALGLKRSAYPFGHGAEHLLPDGRHLLDTYHCSRYNTNTRRLTPGMFHAVLARAVALAAPGGA